MEIREVQEAVDRWISQYDEGYWPPLVNLARLSEEVGELARELNHEYGPKRKKSSEDDGSIEAELGDIIFTVVAIANSLEIDLTDVVTETLRKVERRDAERWKKSGSPEVSSAADDPEHDPHHG